MDDPPPNRKRRHSFYHPRPLKTNTREHSVSLDNTQPKPLSQKETPISTKTETPS